ncbi:hypothetical protein D3C72_110880 [compost metagenome]
MTDTHLASSPVRLFVPIRWIPFIAAYGLFAMAIVLLLPDVIPLKVSDYVYHIKLAQIMAEHQVIVTPHFLYQLAVIGAQKLMQGPDYYLAGLAVTLASYWVTAVLLYHLALKVLPVGRFSSQAMAVAFALGMTVAMPLPLFAGLDQRHYLGYVAFGVYHNPTLIVLKPLALALFLVVVRAFQGMSPLPAWLLPVSGVLVLLSSLAKPSFAICLVPALGVAALVAWARKRKVNWSLIGVVMASLLLVLAFQFGFTYWMAGDNTASYLKELGGGLSKSKIVWMPFFVIGYWSKFLLGKFLLSLIFPLTVLLCYGRRMLQDSTNLLAWLCFGFGAGYMYLLAEAGNRIVDGNFFWSGSTTLFILFTTSMLFLLRQRPVEQVGVARRAWLTYWLCHAAFWVHVAAGVYFYLITLKISVAAW